MHRRDLPGKVFDAKRRRLIRPALDVADAHNLGFSDATFDAVVGHTILMQFRDPSPVLKELSRVLKPGGLAGFREPAFDGNLCEPPSGARRQYSTLFNRMLDHNGSDPQVGRRLGGLMHHRGFGRVTTSSSYEVAGTADAKQRAYERIARLCVEEAGWLDQAIALGWISEDGRASLAAALRAEGATPEAFWAAAFCEAIGWKDTPAHA